MQIVASQKFLPTEIKIDHFVLVGLHIKCTSIFPTKSKEMSAIFVRLPRPSPVNAYVKLERTLTMD